MKRFGWIVTVLALCFLLSGCAAGPKVTVAVDSLQLGQIPSDAPRLQYYALNEKDAAALLKIAESYDYDEALCDCSPAYGVYLDDESTVRYGIDLEEPYIRYEGGQDTLSEADAQAIAEIFERNLVQENER